jgi:hypothetical protein
LRHKAAEFEIHDSADELIAPADLSEIVGALCKVAEIELLSYQSVDFRLRQALMSLWGLHAHNLLAIDPLLQCGIADSENIHSFPRLK